jgi:hypothetical protein
MAQELRKRPVDHNREFNRPIMWQEIWGMEKKYFKTGG